MNEQDELKRRHASNAAGYYGYNTDLDNVVHAHTKNEVYGPPVHLLKMYIATT